MGKLLGKITVTLVSSYFLLVSIDSIIFFYKLKKNDQRKTEFRYTDQYLHPYWFFSFPPIERTETYGKTWYDERGFVGAIGPESKGDRKLAFLIGGSTAFGDGASSPDKNIAALWNKQQEEYFFVNAGIPSFNSYQELLRVMKQLIKYQPKLIVSLTGYNDINIAHSRRGVDLPPDAYESFEYLYTWVEDIRSNRFRGSAVRKYLMKDSFLSVLVLRNLKNEINLFVDSNYRDYSLQRQKYYKFNTIKDQDYVKETSLKFLENMNYIHQLSKANNIKFLAFLQPNKKPNEFYRNVINEINSKNLTYIKDIVGSMMKYESSFKDDCHFTDKGYEHLSKVMLPYLKSF